MPPTRIVKAFDELEDRVARLGLRFEPAASQQLAFQRGKETLGHRIVVGIAYTAHRRPHTRFAAAVAELDGRVLGGFKWSSQRAVCWPIVEVRQVPLPAFSIRVSCVAVC